MLFIRLLFLVLLISTYLSGCASKGIITEPAALKSEATFKTTHKSVFQQRTIQYAQSISAIKRLLESISELQVASLLTVVSSELNVRLAPSLNAPVVLRLLHGMDLKQIEIKTIDSIIWVSLEVGEYTYWVAKKDLSTSKKYLSNVDSEERKQIVNRGIPLSAPSIYIDKKKRILFIIDGKDTPIKIYKIGLGIQPNGSKEIKGDDRTPEGRYYVAHVNPVSKYGNDPDTGGPLPSFLLSYPNPWDAWRGLQQGVIDIGAYKSIMYSFLQRSIPSQRTGLGGYIMIHGNGSDRDWTNGCIALENNQIKELSSLISVGVNVEIN
jgi:hypothetical protein